LKEEWVKASPAPIPELAEEFQVSEISLERGLSLKMERGKDK